MNKKLEFMIIGSTLSLLNIFLIETRFNIIGLIFGIIAVVFFIKAILIKDLR